MDWDYGVLGGGVYLGVVTLIPTAVQEKGISLIGCNCCSGLVVVIVVVVVVVVIVVCFALSSCLLRVVMLSGFTVLESVTLRYEGSQSNWL